jgi:serine/threonine-protein kinase
MSLLEEGQTINDKWVVERFLGEGAFSEVYRVRHRIFGRQAMKVFKRVGMELEEAVEILQEAILLAGINHPNIVRVFDADTTETSRGICCFFTMEYVAGGTLERFWKSFGDQFVPVETTVLLMKQVAEGLCLAHRNNPPIVHRDIKPQNILVGYDDTGLRVRIADFGLAKRFNVLTLALTGLGTRLFKPPEILRNIRADSPAGDVWALGTCFYLLLTDTFPYADSFDFEDVKGLRFDRPLTVPSRLNVSVDKYLDSLLLQCLAPNPKDRIPDAMRLLEELNAWSPEKRRAGEKSLEGAGLSDVTKDALGQGSPLDEQSARTMIREALQLAKSVGKLNEAADLMEEAFNKWPRLRADYEYKVTIWRKGIAG